MDGWLIETLETYPYVSVALVFLACGLGAPLPEEIVLLMAGYVTWRGGADRETMMIVGGASILAGDLIPFTAGKLIGPNLLRLRVTRYFITPERLARFDRWFRRRGDYVVFLSRFVAGMRVVSFFIAGTMRMSWTRFLALDGAGIALIVPPLIWLGDHYGGTIELVIAKVQTIERGILVGFLSIAAVAGLWYWLRWRRQQRLLVGGPAETYVEPTPSDPAAPVARDAETTTTPDPRPAADVDTDADDAAPPREAPSTHRPPPGGNPNAPGS